ncbi:MAG TPA: hypothetical protein VGD96_17425 [Bradyrhizobium sp.]
MQEEPTIFVIEIPEGPDLVFQADCATRAATIARAPWLRDAIDTLLTATGHANVVRNSPRIRTATRVEARTYWELREEFDELTSPFLVANLSGFRER